MAGLRAVLARQWTSQALHRTAQNVNQFPQQVQEILGYLDDARTGQHVRALPGQGSHVPVHILGSSTFGATLAAQLGLPYVFASHFAPQQMMEALDAYRAGFRPSEVLDKPHAIVAAGAVVADTGEKARRVFTSMQQRFATLASGNMRLLPPVDDIEKVWDPQQRHIVTSMLAEAQVGSPTTVRDGLADLQSRTGADELMLMTETWDIADRVRNYELLGDVWNA